MFGTLVSDPYVVAFNAMLLGLWAVSPVLIIGLARQMISARRVRAEFSLRNLETIELDRAILLYEKASSCLKEIARRGDDTDASLWARYRLRAQAKRQYGSERKDLEAYAQHLRMTIIRLRQLPIERLRSFIHIRSARFAFGLSLALYAAIMAVLVAIFYFDDLTWAEEIKAYVDALLLWTPLDERLLYANWIAAVLAVVAVPVFYLVRRARLRIDHWQETRNLRQFAATDPDHLIPQRQEPRPKAEAGTEEVSKQESAKQESAEQGSAKQESAKQESAKEPASFEPASDDPWYLVLGVSPWATADEIKEAYKAQIKQSHPDRVHGMSSVFRELAEAETKRLNAAYEEGLMSLRPLDYVLNGGSSSHTRH
jgi:DnaJ-domain-containing protein 1